MLNLVQCTSSACLGGGGDKSFDSLYSVFAFNNAFKKCTAGTLCFRLQHAPSPAGTLRFSRHAQEKHDVELYLNTC